MSYDLTVLYFDGLLLIIAAGAVMVLYWVTKFIVSLFTGG